MSDGKLYVAVRPDGEPVLWSIRKTPEDVEIAMQDDDTVRYIIRETSLGETKPVPESLKIIPKSRRDYKDLEFAVKEFVQSYIENEYRFDCSYYEDSVVEEALKVFYGKEIYEKLSLNRR